MRLFALVLAVTAGACLRTRVVEQYVTIKPPNCRERDAPRPPAGARYGDAAWARWEAMELVPWIAEVEAACPKREYVDDLERDAP